MSSTAVLALGSNLGDREGTIRAGIRDIGALPGVRVTAASGLVETPALKPEGVDADAPAYLNAIERQHGRVRDRRWGDRTLDIDIVEFAGATIASDDLTVPHPRAHERAFVLAPWLQADPDAVLTGRGRVADLLTETPDTYPAEPLL